MSETNQDGIKMYQFARECDGMIIGAVQGNVGQFTNQEDPEKQQDIRYYFITPDHAVNWVKNMCRKYLGRQDVDFVKIDVGSRLTVPSGRLKV